MKILSKNDKSLCLDVTQEQLTEFMKKHNAGSLSANTDEKNTAIICIAADNGNVIKYGSCDESVIMMLFRDLVDDLKNQWAFKMIELRSKIAERKRNQLKK